MVLLAFLTFLTFLTFLDHLHVQGRPVQVCVLSSISDLVPCLSSNFFMPPLMLSLHLFFCRPLLLSQKHLVLAISHRCGCVLTSSLLFSRKVSTRFTRASFLMYSVRMWSNLVFPLAHLNILISAEVSLFSSFFFTAQHSEPYVIAGLMIVLRLCLSILRAYPYRTSPRILPFTSSTRLLFYCEHQHVNLPHT